MNSSNKKKIEYIIGNNIYTIVYIFYFIKLFKFKQ